MKERYCICCADSRRNAKQNPFRGDHVYRNAPVENRADFPSISSREIGGKSAVARSQRVSIDMATPKGVHETSGSGRSIERFPDPRIARWDHELAGSSPSPLNGERAGVRGETVRLMVRSLAVCDLCSKVRLLTSSPAFLLIVACARENSACKLSVWRRLSLFICICIRSIRSSMGRAVWTSSWTERTS